MSKPKIYLIKCPRCKSENYIYAVEENICVWCEYEASLEDVDGINVCLDKVNE